MKYEIPNNEIRRIASRFKRWSKGLQKEIAFDLAEGAQSIRNNAIQDVPVDHGILKGGMYVEKVRSNGLLWEVGNTVKYAPFQEFGTGRRVSLTYLEAAGYPRSFANQFRGSGKRQVNLQPQPFLFPNVVAESKLILKNMKRTFSDYGRKF